MKENQAVRLSYDCPDCCGLLITVEDGKAVCVAGDPAHAFTRGTLCPEDGPLRAHGPLAKAHPDAAKASARRVKGACPIGWDEAIEEIAGAGSPSSATTAPRPSCPIRRRHDGHDRLQRRPRPLLRAQRHEPRPHHLRARQEPRLSRRHGRDADRPQESPA